MSFFSKGHLIAPCAIFLAVCLSGCGGEKNQSFQPQALSVDVFTVTTMDVPVVSHLSGRANPTRKAEVRPQVNGVIQKRLFTEGAIIEQGEQLYQIDPAVYEAKLASAEASLSSAKATLHSTQLKAERYGSLLQQKAVSKQDYDDAEAAYLSAKAAVESAQANVRSAKIDLAYTKVYAPISGTIGKSEVTEGSLVSAQQVTALSTIQQLDPIYVDLGETVEEHMQLRKNLSDGKLVTADGKAKVDIYFANGEKYPYQGTVEFADVTVDATTGMVNLRALVPNPDHIILPSMFLRADINQGITPQALIVSANGVQREAGGVVFAYVVDENSIVQRRELKLGTEYKSFYVVLEGLNKGDKVITSNIQKIHTGIPVTPVEEKEGTQSAGENAQNTVPSK